MSQGKGQLVSEVFDFRGELAIPFQGCLEAGTQGLRAGASSVCGGLPGPTLIAQTDDSHQLNARAVELPEAASADLVVLAVPFVHVGDVGTAIGDWTGKVVVDATNQFATASPYQGRADTEGLTGNEWVAAKLPGATVIKAFNAMFGAFIAADPRHAEGRQIVFFAADPSPAKDAFADMVDGFGFAPVDLGSLADGGRLIQLGGPLSGVNALRQS